MVIQGMIIMMKLESKLGMEGKEDVKGMRDNAGNRTGELWVKVSLTMGW